MATPTRITHPHIVKEPDYCGGKAAVDDTGVRVMNVVFLHKRGETEAGILEAYPDLDRAQVYAALAYYYDHPEEIEPYVGKVIVVIDQKIVAVGTNSLELRRAFVDRQDAYIRFVAPYRRPRMWRLGPASASI